MLKNIDAIKGMKELSSASINIIYTDPPYNMSSRYVIDKVTGHYVFKGKGKDFMSKWEAMDGKWWEEYFNEAFRIVKYGGFVIMHNIDRQSDMWTYYARKAGFQPMQKLYWLFISNFPKATDVALMIDKKLGVKRKVIGQEPVYMSPGTGVYGWNSFEIAQRQKKQILTDMRGGAYIKSEQGEREKLVRDVTAATSELAIKYDGYKYGQAPLKQIMEEILVFQKPSRKSIVEDIFDLEKGDNTIHPSIFNIKDTRILPSFPKDELARFTPQMAVDSRLAPYMRSHRGKAIDTANLSKALAVVDMDIPYLKEDFDDIYYYSPKASKSEKEEGLDGFDTVLSPKAKLGYLVTPEGRDKWATMSKNPHPTAKPLALCKWVLTLFKPPVPIVVLDTFAGQGSIPKACEEMGIKWIAFEINPEYFKVAEAKIRSSNLTLF